ncbi:MAG: ribosome silencing factor [Treponema sp.]|nr:ribosome silencing factor [Treponema sp.]
MLMKDNAASPPEGVLDYPALAQEMGALLRDHKGADVAVLDLRELNAWTDFFVIATITSHTHVQGLLRHIKEYAQERGLTIFRSRRKTLPEDEWRSVDMGGVVIHLMTEKSRSFYELERLWSSAPQSRF